MVSGRRSCCDRAAGELLTGLMIDEIDKNGLANEGSLVVVKVSLKCEPFTRLARRL